MRRILKRLVLEGLEWSGLNAIMRRRRRQDLVALSYHGVLEGNRRAADRNIYGTTVSTHEFEGHLAFLKRHFHPVRASEAEEWAHGERELPPNAVLVTFDDGFRNNLTHAAPLLMRYGVPAILFVATGYLGTRRILWPQELYEIAVRWPREEIPHPGGTTVFSLAGARRARARQLCEQAKRMPMSTVSAYLDALRQETPLPEDVADSDVYAFLTWEQARQWTSLGFDIGSHTVSHWILTGCREQELRRELEDSKRDIERRLGVACTSFCYPNGGPKDWSAEAAAAVRAAGYRAAYTLADRVQSKKRVNAYAIDRVEVPGHVGQAPFRARVSGSVEALRALLSGAEQSRP